MRDARLKGAPREVHCFHCNGTGKQEHICRAEDLVKVETIYNYGEGSDYSSSMYIKACHLCGQIWKVRYQNNAGTGDDTIWLKPGQNEEGYEFGMGEARIILKAAREALRQFRITGVR